MQKIFWKIPGSLDFQNGLNCFILSFHHFSTILSRRLVRKQLVELRILAVEIVELPELLARVGSEVGRVSEPAGVRGGAEVRKDLL